MSLKQSSNIVSLIDYITEEKSSITKFFILMEYCSSNLFIFITVNFYFFSKFFIIFYFL